MVSKPARRSESGGTITKLSKENRYRRKKELEWELKNDQEGENLLGRRKS